MALETIQQGVETLIPGSSPAVRSYDPTIFSLSNGNFVIINQNNQYSERNFILTVYDSNNELVKIVVLPKSYTFNALLQTPDLVETATGFAVSYSTGSNFSNVKGDVYLQTFDFTGNAVSGPRLINSVSDSVSEPRPEDYDADLAFTNDNRIVAVWTETISGGDANIAVQVFDASGNKLGAQSVVNNVTVGIQTLAKASALDNGTVAVTWTDGSTLKGQILSSAGLKIGAEFTVATSGFEVVDTFATDNGFIAYWRANDGVHLREFNVDGTTRGPDTILTGVVASGEVRVATHSSGGAIVSWGNQAQIFDAAGQPISQVFQVTFPLTGTPLSELMVVQLADGSLMSVGIGPTSPFQAASSFRAELYLGQKPQDLSGTAGQDYIQGDDRANFLAGQSGTDFLYGFGGNDVLNPGLGGGLLDGGSGNDTASFEGIDFGISANLKTGYAIGAVGELQLLSIENLIGGFGNDNLLGDDFANNLNGGPGNDVITTGKGGDVIIGGAGPDTVSYLDSNGTVLVNLTLGLGYNNYADSDSFVTIENVIGSFFNDILIGNSEANRLDGSLGLDVLIGALGPDILDGGADADTVSYEDSIGTVFINLTLGRGYNNSAEGDTYISIENATGSRFNDFIIGDAAANRLDGQLGDDILIGALGADVLVGGDGIDTASYEDNQGAVFVNLSTGQGFSNAAQGDAYFGIENVNGGMFSDYIIGDSGTNRLDGMGGDDILIGGLGGDVLVGGSGMDTASYEDNWGAVFVNLITGAGASNAAQGDTYESIEGLLGSVFYDTFIGNDVRNVLNGKRGVDTLTGNGGNDDFVFDTAIDGSTNVDRITDFTPGQDRLILDNSIFFTLGDGTLQPNNFIAETVATGGQNRIVYDQSTGNLWFDDDGNGSDPAILFAVLENKPALTGSDFFVV